MRLFIAKVCLGKEKKIAYVCSLQELKYMRPKQAHE